MITEQDGNGIKEIIGSNFLDKISNRLEKKKIRNRRGGQISNAFICLLLKGERVHEEAEKEIWNLSEETVTEREKQKERQEEILERHKALNS